MQHTELLIVGAGPSGLAALLWADQLGIEQCTVLESARNWGGQLRQIHHQVQDFLGLPLTGVQMMTEIDRQLSARQHKVQLGQSAIHIDPQQLVLTTETGLRYQAQAILLAPGLAARTLAFPGKEPLLRQSARVSFFQDPDFFKGASVAVVGGGDGALENAFHLSKICPQVHLLVRDQIRARADLVARLRPLGNVHWHCQTIITDLLGQQQLQAVEVNHDRQIQIQKILINIGYTPNTRWLSQTVQLDADGFIEVDPWQQTSWPSIWAVGDACAPRYPSLSLAVGQASVALKRIVERKKPNRPKPAAGEP